MSPADMPPEDGAPAASDAPDEGPPRHEIDPKLLECLICPVSHGPLEYDRAQATLISRQARLVYPIRDGVPIMLESDAAPLED